MTSEISDTPGLLRAHGLKVTSQRVAVFDVMRELGHASADMVCQRCGGAATTATIYNTLDCLVRAGLLQKRLTPNNRMFFDITVRAHCHIYDEETNVYSDYSDDALMEMVEKKIMKDIKGFDVSGIEIQIVGRRHHDDK